MAIWVPGHWIKVPGTSWRKWERGHWAERSGRWVAAPPTPAKSPGSGETIGGGGQSFEVPPATEGLRVIVRRIRGLTPRGLLTVPFLFQCPPLENFDEQYSYNHNDYMTAFAGERSRPAGRQLATFQFETLVLDDIPSWALNQEYMPHPILVKRELMRIHDNGYPFQLLIHQMPLWGYYDVNVAATLRSLTVSQKHGESDARYFQMQFREFRDTRIVQRRKGARQVATTTSNPLTFLVSALPDSQATLQLLAKRYLGSASEWPRIVASTAGASIHNVGPSEDLRNSIMAGEKITIPGVAQRYLAGAEDVPVMTFRG